MCSRENTLLQFFATLFLVCACRGCYYAITERVTQDFSDLKGVWPLVVPEQSGYKYEISLCKPLTYTSGPQGKICKNSSVCLFSNSDALNLADYEDISYNLYASSGLDFFVIDRRSATYRTTFGFSCGPHLGSPVLEFFQPHHSYIFWRTSSACQTVRKYNEVRCYAYDASGNKIDLTPLIKQNDAYFVKTSDPSTQLIMNVCSDDVPGCPKGSSICKINVTSSGNEVSSLGRFKSGLLMEKDDAVLMSSIQAKANASCTEISTKIVFKCPRLRKLKRSSPKLVSTTSCTYNIEWETEYACPTTRLTADMKQCRFVVKNHSVDIDLRPLELSKGYYEVDGEVNGKSVKFLLNVCGSIGNICGTYGGTPSACMIDLTTNATSNIGGNSDATFTFADGQLYSTCLGFQECPIGIRERTVINFVCGTEDKGRPIHISSDNCVHVFEWKTVHACIRKTKKDLRVAKDQGMRESRKNEVLPNLKREAAETNDYSMDEYDEL